MTRDLRPSGGAGTTARGRADREGTGRRRALGAAVRLMDRASLRIGGSEHTGQVEAFGATTLQRRHVDVHAPHVNLVFRGKSGSEWDVTVKDPDLADFLGGIPTTPRTAPAVAYPVTSGRRREWKGVTAAEVNDYLTDVARESYVDPRVVDLFERGRVMDLGRQPDRALLQLLTGRD